MIHFSCSETSIPVFCSFSLFLTLSFYRHVLYLLHRDALRGTPSVRRAEVSDRAAVQEIAEGIEVCATLPGCCSPFAPFKFISDICGQTEEAVLQRFTAGITGVPDPQLQSFTAMVDGHVIAAAVIHKNVNIDGAAKQIFLLSNSFFHSVSYSLDLLSVFNL